MWTGIVQGADGDDVQDCGGIHEHVYCTEHDVSWGLFWHGLRIAHADRAATA